MGNFGVDYLKRIFRSAWMDGGSRGSGESAGAKSWFWQDDILYGVEVFGRALLLRKEGGDASSD